MNDDSNQKDPAVIPPEEPVSNWQPAEPDDEPAFLSKLNETTELPEDIEPVVLPPDPAPEVVPAIEPVEAVEPVKPVDVIEPVVEPVIEPAPARVQTPGPVAPAPAPVRSTAAAPAVLPKKARPDGVTVTAIYHFISGLPMVLLGLMFLIIMMFMPLVIQDSTAGLTISIIVLGFLFLFFLLSGGLAIATGVGLLQMKNWARWLAIIQALLALLNFPIGTIIGGLIIAYLFSDSTREAFENQ